MKYQVVLSQLNEGLAVSCTGLPGCWSEGATEEEALQSITEAIRDNLEVAAELARESKSLVREVEIPFRV